MKSEPLRVKFLKSRRRISVANQFYRDSNHAQFKRNCLYYQNFWRLVEWPSIQRSCTFIPSAAFQLHHKILFDATFYFLIRSSGKAERCGSWRPGCHDVSQEQIATLIFFPLHTLSLLSCPWARHSLWTQAAMLRDTIKDTLNWITYLICLYKWFLFQFWCFSWTRKSRMSTSFIRRKVYDHVHKTKRPPPPLRGELCFLGNGSFSFCGKTLVANYTFRNTNGSLCVISGFRREVNKICAVLGYYAAYSLNFFTDVSGQPIGPIFKGQ